MGLASERILILAPFGRDGFLLQQVLAHGQIAAEVCANFDALCQAMKDGLGALLVGDEALGAAEISRLRSILEEQPSWSDVNLLVMTSGGEATLTSQHRLQLLEPLQTTVTLLERPLRAVTLLSVARFALRARRRQYQVRDLLEQEKQNTASLQQANQALRQSNERLEEFAYAASHDLQEPLRIINIYTELLLRRVLSADPDAKQYANFIHQGGRRMEELIRDLLSYSRTLHADEQPLSTADLSAVLAETLVILQGRIDETGAIITSEPLPLVSGDPTQLTLVFQNLLSNSLKYQRVGATPAIHLSAARQGNEWVISVQDNGIGFHPQYAERIFGLFKRLHKDEYPGTGLGLAICQRIIERSGGRIWAEGRPGEGSTFFMAFPTTETADAPPTL